MEKNRKPSVADGFWMTLLVSGPLLALAAFPYVPRAVSTGCLILCSLLATGWLAIPSLRWAWQHLRDAREAAVDLAVTRRIPSRIRAAIVAGNLGSMRYPQPR